ncbi:hypothetical protein [Agromyces sp. NBRC 114283]|uniref:hypothetical protein n=1 Tax=Agromyces sp. NBRC 114283 TaxID=2994521 RepID=UPI0024A41874|nr:hypothetical protein [Agromyces sp. NBRC 114283]GLU91346.1 hypothetical protein Agsp01_36010 [Agromyces sp. NBRC 114283]
MAMRVYATAEEYAGLAEEPWDGAPEALVKRLRSASIEVEKLTRRTVYATDADGYPTDPDIDDAFMEATCAITEYWAETDDPAGAAQYEGAVKIGSVSLGTTSSSSEGLTEREKLERRIGTKAISILTNAGLIGSAVAHT